MWLVNCSYPLFLPPVSVIHCRCCVPNENSSLGTLQRKCINDRGGKKIGNEQLRRWRVSHLLCPFGSATIMLYKVEKPRRKINVVLSTILSLRKTSLRRDWIVEMTTFILHLGFFTPDYITRDERTLQMAYKPLSHLFVSNFFTSSVIKTFSW